MENNRNSNNTDCFSKSKKLKLDINTHQKRKHVNSGLKVMIESKGESREIETGESSTAKNVAPKPTIVSPLFDGDRTCSHEVFDWLSLAQIGTVAATCKRIQEVAGDYFKTYLAATTFEVKSGNILKSHNNIIGLSTFIRKARIVDVEEKSWNMLAKCRSLENITIHGEMLKITEGHGERIKTILNNVEEINWSYGQTNGDLYDCILRHCKNLKRFSLQVFDDYEDGGSDFNDYGHKWHVRHYPKLEHFKFNNLYASCVTPQLTTFFEQNWHIKKLEFDIECFYHLRDTFLKSKLKLDDLIFEGATFSIHNHDKHERNVVFHLLHQFYGQEFYKRLHICKINMLREDEIDQLLKVPGLEAISCYEKFISKVHLFRNLRGLCINLRKEKLFRNINDCLQDVAIHLSKLQRLFFLYAELNHILPFVQRSVNLRRIRAQRIDRYTFDLHKLNQERAKLLRAQKLLIYLNEEDFLYLKWTNKTVNLSMIELRRIDSYEWPDYTLLGAFR